MKQCSKCGKTKPFEGFWKSAKGKNGLHSQCNVCKSASRKNNPEYNLNKHLLKMYGITLEKYKEILAQQKGFCPVCRRHESELVNRHSGRFHVDHDHLTGKVRGLLCFNCNIGLGNFMDSTDRLEAAIGYLKKASS